MSSSLNLPFREDEVKDYERKRYRGLDQKIVHGREERILRKILKKIGQESPLALDVPCGYGRFSSLFLRRGLRLVSSDFSLPMVRRARERSEHPGWPLAVVANLKEGLPFKESSFHSLFSIRFFHHLHLAEEREAILREFSRVSQRYVVLSYYQMNWLHSLQRKLRRLIKRSKTRIKMISRGQLEREVQEAGLRIVRIFPLFRGIHAYKLALLEKPKI